MKTVLNNIRFQVDLDALKKSLRIREGSSYVERLERFTAEAEPIAKPKALLRVVYIDHKGDDSIIIDGVTLNSRVLRVNLDKAHRVFAYVATCGTELDAWAQSQDDILKQHWADTVATMAMRTAIRAMDEYIQERYRPVQISAMSPGRLEDWPLRAQRDLFKILGDPEADIGVRLLPSMWMTPSKSVSGIRFPTEESFESCQLCPREDCPGRKAPYDPELLESRYAIRRPS